jgi:hypothetical protein
VENVEALEKKAVQMFQEYVRGITPTSYYSKLEMVTFHEVEITASYKEEEEPMVRVMHSYNPKYISGEYFNQNLYK